MISCKGLVKYFGRTRALDGVSLSVKEGEVLGFLGPNGAGKSTTIRVLLGLIRADAGSAKIFGMDCWKDAVEIHERVSYIPGEVNLWGNLTGGEVIDIFLGLDRSLRRGQNQKIVEERREYLLELFELDPTVKVKNYSKGNKQKVALVAAFCQDADLFIFDEPTSGLDPLMQKRFEECVLERKQMGKAVLLSSHIMSEVEALADNIAIIRRGKIIGYGSMEELRQIKDEFGNSVSLEELFLQAYQT